jgi:hypothetical protein
MIKLFKPPAQMNEALDKVIKKEKAFIERQRLLDEEFYKQWKELRK